MAANPVRLREMRIHSPPGVSGARRAHIKSSHLSRLSPLSHLGIVRWLLNQPRPVVDFERWSDKFDRYPFPIPAHWQFRFGVTGHEME